ncbi:FkbM family methyltransferase [Inquilinus sp.]|uniref:FkbM family methyltransferase n=1 Tax=Inquilinus sp. TaxID=1932117 RepID=UPI0031DFB30C
MFRGAFKYLGRAMAIGAIQHLADKGYLRAADARLNHIEAALRDLTAFPPTPQASEEAPAAGDGRLIELDQIPPFRMKTHDYGDDQFVSRSIIDSGNWEPLETEIARRLLPNFSLFVDLGANIGWYSALARQIMPHGSTVHAFEPDPRNFDLLVENARGNDTVRVHTVAAAVSDTIGSASLYHSAGNRGDHRLYASDEDRPSITVPVTTLDAYFGGRPLPPCLVKMDTQGSEPRIFRGGKTVLSPGERLSALLVEFWPYGMSNAGEDIDGFITLLSTYPQHPFLIDHAAHRLRPVAWEELRRRSLDDLAPPTQGFVDLVMVTPGSPAFLAVAGLIDAG